MADTKAVTFSDRLATPPPTSFTSFYGTLMKFGTGKVHAMNSEKIKCFFWFRPIFGRGRPKLSKPKNQNVGFFCQNFKKSKLQHQERVVEGGGKWGPPERYMFDFSENQIFFFVRNFCAKIFKFSFVGFFSKKIFFF